MGLFGFVAEGPLSIDTKENTAHNHIGNRRERAPQIDCATRQPHVAQDRSVGDDDRGSSVLGRRTQPCLIRNGPERLMRELASGEVQDGGSGGFHAEY